MARILGFPRRGAAPRGSAALAAFLRGFSMEVMPRTAAKIPDFRAVLPEGTRIYIAHVDGTPIGDMVSTARRLRAEGFPVMPHVPARVVATKARLADWLARYADAGVSEALLLAGGVSELRGELHHSMHLLETGLFDAHGFTRLHVAGHPEGNRDIAPDGSDTALMEALRWKAAFGARTDARMAIVTQFGFESAPMIDWAQRLRAEGIGLPVHIGVAGPAKLQTLVKFAMSCGVGPSMRVLTRRAADVSRLLLPFTPLDILTDLAEYRAANPGFNIEAVHFFPLGGITATGAFVDEHGRAVGGAAAYA
ncbi:methylenetetrahydrofolate reductase [Paroceanicella profunda]|uniref:Methylenetetrahydrofolate reductase n=1 Tax=Paroceanicella profunda TaxID=2579971 RepID=A0A5B8FI30_9RHOB|nr:methylenetetrahydrofolate reductase [Paroceanicella profunda]QDL92877.1 methylenetetrahydrofolate reductase [Paroceanicella profunda]